MILYYPHTRITWTTKNKIHKSCRYVKPLYKVKCDKCGKIFFDKVDVFEKRINLTGDEFCGKCSRSKMSRLAGLSGAYDSEGNLKPNKGRFSSEKVKALSDDEYEVYCKRRRKIANDYHAKLKADPELKKKHYQKVFKNSTFGYISKGQNDIYQLLKNDGYELEYYIGGCKGDIVNPDKKIVVEYNGDFWHANPRMFSPDEYIDVIKMTAREKWNKDRARRFFLRSQGYEVLVIWENEWINNRKSVLNKLDELTSDNHTIPKWYNTSFDVKTKKMCNKKLDLNKYVELKDVDKFLENGWIYGHIRRKEEK